jgi:hypothetical protein
MTDIIGADHFWELIAVQVRYSNILIVSAKIITLSTVCHLGPIGLNLTGNIPNNGNRPTGGFDC